MSAASQLVFANFTRGVRITSDRRYSVLDFIRSFIRETHRKDDLKTLKSNASVTWKRLQEKYPDLVEMTSYHQFQERRARPTPMFKADDLFFLVTALQSKVKGMKKPSKRPTAPLLVVHSLQQAPLYPDREGPYPAPYGWRWHPLEDMLIPVRAEHQTLEYARKLRAFGETTERIIKQFEQDKILPRGGGKWTVRDLFLLLEYDHSEHWREWDNK